MARYRTAAACLGMKASTEFESENTFYDTFVESGYLVRLDAEPEGDSEPPAAADGTLAPATPPEAPEGSEETPEPEPEETPEPPAPKPARKR